MEDVYVLDVVSRIATQKNKTRRPVEREKEKMKRERERAKCCKHGKLRMRKINEKRKRERERGKRIRYDVARTKNCV
jgi:hypothetical protein